MKLDKQAVIGIALAAAALVAGLALFIVNHGRGSDANFRGADVTGVTWGRGFKMKDVDGRERTLEQFRGKVVVLFFGYTQCPDVCPTTMLELAQAKQALGPAGDKVQGVFITVDPERDTAPLLKAYLANFDPSFVALRGSADETRVAANEFKVYYAKVPGSQPGSYTMDHTAASFIFDADGRLRVFEKYGKGDDLAADIKTLLDGH